MPRAARLGWCVEAIPVVDLQLPGHARVSVAPCAATPLSLVYEMGLLALGERSGQGYRGLCALWF